tara:strand:+ start:111 stop:650 length:540 start_codon:yes stop_codon:yes gene_type:complete
MATASYFGGRFTERTWYRPPVLAGLAVATLSFLLIGLSWNPNIGFSTMAWQLAMLGSGFGLVIAPISAAVVDIAHPNRRGAAASVLLTLRMVGLSVGLSSLTAWGLHRYNELREKLVLPPLNDPGYGKALGNAQAELTVSSLSETFVAAAVVLMAASIAALTIRRSKEKNGALCDLDDP